MELRLHEPERARRVEVHNVDTLTANYVEADRFEGWQLTKSELLLAPTVRNHIGKYYPQDVPRLRESTLPVNELRAWVDDINTRN